MQKFWVGVTQYISQFTSSPIPLCPVLCVLSMYEDDCSLSTKERKLVDLCLLQARRSIALCWKNTNCPSIGLWLKNVICLALEKLTYVIRKTYYICKFYICNMQNLHTVFLWLSGRALR